MKNKSKKADKVTLSDKIADALTLKPRPDIEDDHVFGTKPKTLSRAEFGSSESEDETAISDFRKRNVKFLSNISKKYEGQVVTRKELEDSDQSAEVSSDEDGFIENEGQESSQESEVDTLSKIKTQLELDSDESVSDVESDDYSITKSVKSNKLLDQNDEERSNDSNSEDEDESVNEDDGEGYDISQMEEPMRENFEHVKKQNISEEAKKGSCVRNQLLIWESLLEMRINLQKCVNTANRMPMTDTYEELKSHAEFIEDSNIIQTNVTKVLDKLLSLQNLLLKSFPETKSIAVVKQANQDLEKNIKGTKMDSDNEIQSDTDNEEIPSDTEEEDNVEAKKEVVESVNNKQSIAKKRKLPDYENEIAKTHKAFKSFRDSSIQKWHEKTKLASTSNIKNAPTNTILQQISYILSDRDKLVKRTQLKRSEYEIIGYKKHVEENLDENITENSSNKERKANDEYIPEIFDDSDFYHQLLRELIECKSADISDPVQLSRQWIALQQMRSKMKRKVDTKATKGRKIKYVVHNKLVNFMAPEKNLTWTDESTNELYNSLFGKMFERNNVGVDVNIGNGFKLK